MFDHVTINVVDYQRSLEFYKRALAPLGYTVLMGDDDYSGFGDERPQFWLSRSDGAFVLDPDGNNIEAVTFFST